MKKIISASVIILIVFVFGNLFAQSFVTPTMRDIGAPEPYLKIVDKDSTFHTNNIWKKNQTTLLMLFNPTCGHCIKMTKMIGANSKIFNKCNVWLVSASGTQQYLDHFYKETGADSFKHMTIGADTVQAVPQLYVYGLLPQINIYSRKTHKLIKIFNGDTPIDSLKKYIGK